MVGSGSGTESKTGSGSVKFDRIRIWILEKGPDPTGSGSATLISSSSQIVCYPSRPKKNSTKYAVAKQKNYIVFSYLDL